MNKFPEFQSVASFVEFRMEDDENTFTHGDAQKISENIRKPLMDVINELKDYGLVLVMKNKNQEVRGVNSNNHDRFTSRNGFVGGCGLGSDSRHMVSRWQPT